MKLKRPVFLSALRRSQYLGLICCSTLILTACGDSGVTVSAPDIGAAEELIDTGNPTVDPPTPTTGPESPTTDPQTPGNGTETPTTDPETPVIEPGSTPTDPEIPGGVLDDAIALSGSVSSYPDSADNESVAASGSDLIFADDTGNSSSDSSVLTRANMRPVQALVSLYLLSDIDFQTPVATVRSDRVGNYNVKAEDVRAYLLQQQLILQDATDDEVLASFRSLGRLQVRAVIMRERNGVTRAMAIQSIADPADVDETGAPVPVAIDPIVHRVVKAIVDSIRDSVDSLESMGLAPTLVDQLINTVVEEVVAQIDQILEESADEVIEIPDGLSVDDVIDSQEDELELSVEPQQLDQLAVILDGSDEQLEGTQLAELENTVAAAVEISDAEDSTLESSLNSASQGLLSGLENSLNDQLNGSVERKINEAREAGTPEALSEVFGELSDGVELEQALAAVDLEKTRQTRISIQRFFLSLGLGVFIEENSAGDAGVVALRLPLPYHLESSSLPGAAGLGEREIRLFKVGSGELDSDSEYTSNAFVQLGVPGEDGVPLPPFKYVPTLEEISTQVLPGLSPDAAQQAVNEAIDRVFSGFSATPDDYQLLDRVEVLHELRERLHDSTLVSSRVIDTLVANRDRSIPLKRIAASIAQEFEWIQDDIKLTPDGFPIYSGRSGPLGGGANSVDSSELVRALSITLGDTPGATVKNLTENNGFLAQFAPRAVEIALQRYNFNEQTDLTDALLDIYPQEASGYNDLIAGSLSGEPEPEYARERDRLARGLTTALPASMYGQTLNSESKVNIRSALFFLDFILRSEFLVDANRGFYTRFEIVDSAGTSGIRFVPDYSNIKKLEPIGEVSVADMMSELLNITAIDDGDLFRDTMLELMGSLQDIPVVPEYQELSVEAYIDDLGPRSDLVDAVCAVEMFDGRDPDSGEEHQRLKLAVFEVDYIESTGERLAGNRVDAVVTSQLVEGETGVRRVYRISGLPALRDEAYGRDYVLRFDIDSYQNELPELHLYADGFLPEINLCDPDAPLFIGPDQEFFHVPAIGLVSDQYRFQFDSIADPSETEGQFEWVDLSNVEVPGAPLYLTELEESNGQGSADFRLKIEGDDFILVGPDDGEVGFSRLYGEYVDGELLLSLNQSGGMDPMYGLHSAVGANARDVIESITRGDVALSNTLFIASASAAAADSGVQQDFTALLSDDSLFANEFESESLYLFKDREGKFWVIELQFFDSFIEFDNQERAVIDIGFASVNTLGIVDIPNVAYDNAVPEGFDQSSAGAIEYYSLYYGDWLVLENPSDYVGSGVLPPEVLSFAPSDDYNQLARAIDGVVIRYAGEHFSENVFTIDDIDMRFGTPPDFSSVPVRLDAGREGISFIKLAFDKTEKRYVMDPLPQDSARFVTQLNHNDLVAIFDDQSDNDGPVYLARVIRDAPDGLINGYIGLEVLRYDSLADDLDQFDERQVVCFVEDNGSCPEFHPSLFTVSDAVNSIGIVYDSDVDGVPTLFDPNDQDPNIPGYMGVGDDYSDFNGVGDVGDLHIDAVAGVGDDGSTVRALIARTGFVYPGDIENITLKSDLFGADSTEQMVLGCEPPLVDDFGSYSGVRCSANPVAGDVDVELYQQSDQGVSLLMLTEPEALNALGNHIEFAYTINYRAPMTPDGQPLFCGDEVCSARPASTGIVTVPLRRDIPVHDQVLIQAQDQEPVDMLGVRELDVDRELRISAATLPGAVEYELSIFCPSSSSTEEFGTQSYYQPEENIQFFAMARDELGMLIPPEFNIHIPWLAGRECRMELRSYIETDAGDLAGISLYVQGGVKLTGAANGNEFFDNEIALKAGDSVCVVDDNHLSTDNCTADTAVFVVETLGSQSDEVRQAALVLGADVVSAQTYGHPRELLQSTLMADAVISFDLPADGSAARCGEITGTDMANTSCSSDTDNLQEVFAVSADGYEMFSLLQDTIVEGPVNADGNISLLESGYYKIVQWADEPVVMGDGSADTLQEVEVLTSYIELMNVSVEVYDSADGTREVYARFESPGSNDYVDDSTELRQLNVDEHGYIFIRTAQGHEINIDTRVIVDEQLKISFFVHRPTQVSGVHDLNADGVYDVDVFSENGLWYFRFDPSVDGVRDLLAAGDQELSADESGFRVATYDADQGFAEMLVRIAETEYLVFAEFHADGFSTLQVADQFPVAEESLEPLFDGQAFENFFPIELSAASPFARDRQDASVVMDSVEGGLTANGLPMDVFPDEDFSEEAFPEDAFNESGTSAFQADAERIAGILDGRYKASELFRTDKLRGSGGNAHCFGPQLYYQDHPDGPDGEPAMDFANGATEPYASLPTGDLGIWTEYDQVTGNACAAAQMNAQLGAARQRTFAGLVALASVARRLTPEQQADVLSGAEVSVADRMNALSLPNVEFEQASVSLQAGTGEWVYQLTLNESSADGMDSHQSSIEMNFNPGSDTESWDYSGTLRFRIEDSVESSGCTDTSVEHLSSLAFQRVNKELLNTEYRYGMYCGHSGSNGFDDEGMVDPAYSSVLADDGWINNFSVFMANVDPSSGAGSYAYSWQAGVNDRHSRVLNVGLNAFDLVEGEAWYGYGRSLTDGLQTAGEINGFICNWAGPGNNHTLLERAQRQSLMFDDTTALFVVPEGGSNITYAPTNACTYDSDAGGSFLYDRDLDGALGDESVESVDVGRGERLPFDLAPPESSTYFGLDIEEVIQLRGFVKPTRPYLAP